MTTPSFDLFNNTVADMLIKKKAGTLTKADAEKGIAEVLEMLRQRSSPDAPANAVEQMLKEIAVIMHKEFMPTEH